MDPSRIELNKNTGSFEVSQLTFPNGKTISFDLCAQIKQTAELILKYQHSHAYMTEVKTKTFKRKSGVIPQKIVELLLPILGNSKSSFGSTCHIFKAMVDAYNSKIRLVAFHKALPSIHLAKIHNPDRFNLFDTILLHDPSYAKSVLDSIDFCFRSHQQQFNISRVFASVDQPKAYAALENIVGQLPKSLNEFLGESVKDLIIFLAAKDLKEALSVFSLFIKNHPLDADLFPHLKVIGYMVNCFEAVSLAYIKSDQNKVGMLEQEVYEIAIYMQGLCENLLPFGQNDVARIYISVKQLKEHQIKNFPLMGSKGMKPNDIPTYVRASNRQMPKTDFINLTIMVMIKVTDLYLEFNDQTEASTIAKTIWNLMRLYHHLDVEIGTFATVIKALMPSEPKIALEIFNIALNSVNEKKDIRDKIRCLTELIKVMTPFDRLKANEQEIELYKLIDHLDNPEEGIQALLALAIIYESYDIRKAIATIEGAYKKASKITSQSIRESCYCQIIKAYGKYYPLKGLEMANAIQDTKLASSAHANLAVGIAQWFNDKERSKFFNTCSMSPTGELLVNWYNKRKDQFPTHKEINSASPNIKDADRSLKIKAKSQSKKLWRAFT